MFDTTFGSMQRQASIVLVEMYYSRKLSDSSTRGDDKFTAREEAIREHYGEVALNTLIWDSVDRWEDIALRRVGVYAFSFASNNPQYRVVRYFTTTNESTQSLCGLKKKMMI